MFLLCHLWFTTTDLSQRFPILETSAYKMFTPGSFATEELLEKKTLNTRFTGMPKNFYTRTCLILSAFFSGSLAGILNSNFQQPLKSSVLQQLSSRASSAAILSTPWRTAATGIFSSSIWLHQPFHIILLCVGAGGQVLFDTVFLVLGLIISCIMKRLSSMDHVLKGR